MNKLVGIVRFAAVAMAVALVVLPQDTIAQPTTANELLTRVRDRLSGIESLSARFRQTFSSQYFDETESVEGTVLLKGDMYRVEAPGQTFVTDGRVTWIYSANDDQVLINDYVEDETTFSLNAFLFGFEERYEGVDMDTEVKSGGMKYTLRLNAKDPTAFFPHVTMFVDPSDYSVERLQVIDANETMITLDLSNVVLNPLVPEGLFRFEPPASSEIVDLRS